jgi:hypothetical protein
MSQVTIYMNESIEKKVKELAKSMNMSISKYITTLLEEKTNTEWSSEVQNLCGAWSDFPSLATLRENESATDVPRESL